MMDPFDRFDVAFETPRGPQQVSARRYRTSSSARGAALLLAHGAGAGQQHGFMVRYASALAARGIEVVTFNFPYTEAGRRVPDSNQVLEACARAALAETVRRAEGAAVFAGGKSMGGRILSQVAAGDPAAASSLAGLVFLGYPLHPPGRPDQPRTAHWPSLGLPLLFVQGTRDPFASPEELQAAFPLLAVEAEVHIVEGGDHSFAVRKTSGRMQADVDAEVQQRVADWIRSVVTGVSARRS